MGRLDLQVKIRGQRVEIEDVERVIDRIIRSGKGDGGAECRGGSVAKDTIAVATNSIIDGVTDDGRHDVNVLAVGTESDHQQVAVVAETVPTASPNTASNNITTSTTTTTTILLVAFIESSLVATAGTGGGGGRVSTAVLHRILAASKDMPAAYMPR